MSELVNEFGFLIWVGCGLVPWIIMTQIKRFRRRRTGEDYKIGEDLYAGQTLIIALAFGPTFILIMFGIWLDGLKDKDG